MSSAKVTPQRFKPKVTRIATQNPYWPWQWQCPCGLLWRRQSFESAIKAATEHSRTHAADRLAEALWQKAAAANKRRVTSVDVKTSAYLDGTIATYHEAWRMVRACQRAAKGSTRT